MGLLDELDDLQPARITGTERRFIRLASLAGLSFLLVRRDGIAKI
jgi:hypothetical protein